MDTTTVPRRGMWLAVAAVAIVVCMFVLYLVLIAGQGDLGVGRVWFVALMLTAAAACCLVAAVVRDDRIRPVAAWTGAGGLLSLGVLGIFSIGLPLLVAGILMVVAALRIGVTKGGGAPAAAGFFVAALVPWALLLL
jgi:D-alanyl-lipoteichoic acid acyltransferase DltB (MBOAT superfamily)